MTAEPQAFTSVESMLTTLRRPSHYGNNPMLEDLAPAHERMMRGVADWIDAARAHEHGSYYSAVAVLDNLVHSAARNPEVADFADLLDFLNRDGTGDDDTPQRVVMVDLTNPEEGLSKLSQEERAIAEAYLRSAEDDEDEDGDDDGLVSV